ncbi:EamA family transporter RarD [Eubacteriales bacterium OttesenSCG-928-K08]|nr:EamA family transporter RarD [Eubacteriales bacterium OttesenSCG-928-K08]
MNKKSLLKVISGYAMWGILPLFWALLSPLDSIFVLANRLLWSALFTTALLAVTKKLPLLKQTFKDKRVMKFLIPAAIVITCNWGVYIWSVSIGHVMDASLGYYMNPLAVALCGMLVFKEKCTKLELFALLLAAAGVIFSTIQLGKFPFVALILAISFAAYGTFKKFAHADSMASVAVETIIFAPFALLFIIFSPQGAASFAAMTPGLAVLCVCTGVVTAVPMILYSQGVNDLPFAVMGFMQYISPTLMLIVGIANGEPFTWMQAISFAFIWAGLVLYSVSLVRKEKQNKLEKAQQQKG